MPRGPVGYLVFWLCCEQLKHIIVSYDSNRHDQFMMEMRMVLFQVLSAAQFHDLNEDHCDVVFMNMINMFMLHWLTACMRHQAAGEKDCDRASKNASDIVHRPKQRRRHTTKDVLHANDLSIKHPQVWKAVPVKQGERPRKKPSRRRITNDVLHVKDLSIQHLEAWKAVSVKQGETPREGPTTEVIRSYLGYFNLSTDKSKKRLTMLNLLLNFLSENSMNQDGETYSKFRCKKRGEQ